MLNEQISFPGKSNSIRKFRSKVELAAKSTLPVLIAGESGTGKEMAARAIHQLSIRKNEMFVSVNVAAIPDNLIANELLGYAEGTFVNASHERPGFFERANKGTICLDQIDAASPQIQSLLFSVLDSGSVRRIGEDIVRTLDVRIIASTNRDLKVMVSAGQFHPGLFSRLSSIEILIPPLRERKIDVPVIASTFLSLISKREGRPISLTLAASNALKKYDYPGNVRELISIIEKAVIISKGTQIEANDLNLPKVEKKRKRSEIKIEEIGILQRQVDMLKLELESLRSSSIKARPIWQGRNFNTQHDYCFILMPFANLRDLQSVYSDHVKKIVEHMGFECNRADDIYDVSGIMQSVWEGINKANIIIADLTERNPNVFYELGIAHTLGKPVIMLTQSMDFVPFDLRHLKCIEYFYTPKGVAKLEDSLTRTLKTILSGKNRF